MQRAVQRLRARCGARARAGRMPCARRVAHGSVQYLVADAVEAEAWLDVREGTHLVSCRLASVAYGKREDGVDVGP